MNISEGGESRNLEAAFVYLELGWSIIPVHGIVDGACTCGKPDCGREGKHPRINWDEFKERRATEDEIRSWFTKWPCLLYTSDAADDLLCVDLGGRRIIKKKKKKTQ